MNLTKRETALVRAAAHLTLFNVQHRYVPDYKLIENSFGLTADTMREVRDVAQANERQEEALSGDCEI